VQAQGQKPRRAIGEAEIILQNNMSYDEACRMAIQQAMISAINNEFGTYVEQTTNMRIAEGKSTFYIIGTTKVLGQWVKDITPPKCVRKGNEMTSVVCKVEGLVRPASPKPILEYRLLNLPNPAASTTVFYNEEDLYLYFKSPVRGYLSVFIAQDDSTQRILPSEGGDGQMVDGILIEADRDYLFFDPNHSCFGNTPVDELVLFTRNVEQPEYNTVYIVFSEQKYAKPVLEKGGKWKRYRLPMQLSNNAFQSWLTDNRVMSLSFQDIAIPITINPKKR